MLFDNFFDTEFILYAYYSNIFDKKLCFNLIKKNHTVVKYCD